MAKRFSVEAVFKAVDNITAPVTRMQNRVGKMTRSMSRGFKSAENAINGLTRGLKRGAGIAIKYGGIALTGIAAGIALVTREFSKLENAEAFFTPLLGGAKRAKEAVKALTDTAKTTPFQFEALSNAAGQLFPVIKGDTNEVIRILRMLGDTAGGNAQKLDSITRGFSKAMLKGKVDLESLNMIAESGVPIFDDLASVMGVKVDAAFFKMISSGKVSTDALIKAFEKITGEGGKFYKGMEISSKTTTGLLSTFSDVVSQTAATIGEVLSPTIKEMILDLTKSGEKLQAWVLMNKKEIGDKFVEIVDFARTSFMKFIDEIKRINKEKDLFIRLKDFFLATKSVFKFLSKHGGTIAKIVASVFALSIALKTLTAVMIAVNLVMTLNPVGLIVVAIAAAIASIAGLIIWWDDLKEVFSKSPTWMKVVAKGFLFVISPVLVLIDALVSVIDKFGEIKKFAADFDLSDALGFSGEDHESRQRVSQNIGRAGKRNRGVHVIPPQERIARTIEENRSSAELTIRDDTGRAELTGGSFSNSIKMTQTGAM